MSDLISELVKSVRVVPGIRFVEREFAWVEREVLRQLQHRLDLVTEVRNGAGGASAGGAITNGSRPETVEPATLAAAMEHMLRRSMDQTPSDSRRSLFEHLLRELVPDEARILAALADGSSYPLLDVAVAARGGRVVLRNASNVGRAAGVAAPSLVPTYVTHLLQLGLAETAQEDSALHDEYQILLTEAEVKVAHAKAAEAARRGPRIVRGTLQISALGREFWAACHLEHGDS